MLFTRDFTKYSFYTLDTRRWSKAMTEIENVARLITSGSQDLLSCTASHLRRTVKK